MDCFELRDWRRRFLFPGVVALAALDGGALIYGSIRLSLGDPLLFEAVERSLSVVGPIIGTLGALLGLMPASQARE